MPKTLRQKFDRLPFVVAVGFAIVSVLAFSILWYGVKKNIGAAEKAEISWRGEADRRSEVRLLERSLNDSEKEREELETHFAKSSNAVPYLDALEKLGREAGAEAQVTLVEIPGDKTSLLVDVDASGSFESLYKFVRLLENSRYELEFVSMTIKKVEGSGSWDAMLKIKLLSFVP